MDYKLFYYKEDVEKMMGNKDSIIWCLSGVIIGIIGTMVTLWMLAAAYPELLN